MDKLTLRIYGDAVLRKAAAAVDNFGGDLESVADAMIKTMYNEKGIGLAAPQLGVSKRLIVALQMKDLDDNTAPALVLVNPEIIAVSTSTWSYEEGCLSLPGITGEVVRPKEVDIKYQDLSAAEKEISAEGIFGRILLHEIDHLSGKLFIDYLSSAKKSLVKSRLKTIAHNKHLF